ncbi:hypothetical protein MTO96_041098 [Rhipicephalus appendiculatus]
MVPLSQYFRCELTSLVTVGRPASSLDTLEELEAALDAGAAAPCVPTESATLKSLTHTDQPTTLGKKLQRVTHETPGQAGKGQRALLHRLRHEGPMVCAIYLACHRRYRC